MNLIDKDNSIKIDSLSVDDAVSIYNKGYSIFKDTPFINLYESLFS